MDWKVKALDLAERTGATFAQAFLSVLTLDKAHFTEWTAVQVGLVAGAYAVAKYLLVQVNSYLGKAYVASVIAEWQKQHAEAPAPPEPAPVPAPTV